MTSVQDLPPKQREVLEQKETSENERWDDEEAKLRGALRGARDD